MSTMDWVFAGVVLILSVRCFVRGFVQEILSVAAYATGLVSGLLFSNSLIDFAAAQLGTGQLPPTVQYIIAFIICFVVGFLVMKLVEKLVHEGLEAANLEIFDRILGLALGMAEGLAVVALFLVILDMQTFFDVSRLLEESFFARAILPLVGPAVTKTLGPGQSGGIPLNLGELLRKKR